MSDQITVTKPLVRGQFVRGQFVAVSGLGSFVISLRHFCIITQLWLVVISWFLNIEVYQIIRPLIAYWC